LAGAGQIVAKWVYSSDPLRSTGLLLQGPKWYHPLISFGTTEPRRDGSEGPRKSKPDWLVGGYSLLAM